MGTPLAAPLAGLIEEHRREIAEICARFDVRRLELFGSAATGASTRLAATWISSWNSARPGTSSRGTFGLKEALEALLSRPVDLVEAGASTNRYFLESVERSRRLLYAA